jgi:hypothetical protein
LVSETGLLLPGIAKEQIQQEIRHELYPPLEPMFLNFVLKELLPTNGIYATMIDNFKRITVIEQFMELQTLVSYKMRLPPKQSKPCWMPIRI